ncbi:TRML2 protein, partial [Atrichornis clamosus]|nr:TRML2 protein [Atrichornis clamosus]
VLCLCAQLPSPSPHLILTALQGQSPEGRRRREGDTLHLQCSYAAWVTDRQTKYWCLLRDGTCQELVQTSYQYRSQSKDGKMTMEGDTTNKTVSITMTDLKAEDSGTYFCAYYSSVYISLRSISLNVFGDGLLHHPALVTPFLSCSSNVNTFIILSVVLLVLLVLALLTSVGLGVRQRKHLRRTGTSSWGCAKQGLPATALGSTGGRESSQDDSKGPAYINLDVQSHPGSEDPLYCNVEPSQAHRKPQNVEYAVIAFNQSPRNDRG